MVQAASNSNFDAERLAEAISEDKTEAKQVAKGNFNADYELAQEFSTPESNETGTGGNEAPAAPADSSEVFDGSADQPGSPEAFRSMASEVQPDDASR